MKRWISVLLALVLALTLAAPALAAEDTVPPLWQEYGFDSREECIKYWFDGDESAYEEEAAYALERQSWETSMAGEIAAFDADAYWKSEECWMSDYYDSKEEFMEDWLLETEEDFRECMLEEWLDDQWYAYMTSQETARVKAALGGVDGQVGVMVDGAYVQFPDAVPEVRSGRTMVPCRQVLEAFGGQVRHENGQAVCELDGVTLRFQDGYDVAWMTGADGTESGIQMDVPCYYKNGRTYIPVRFFAEALGCDVMWDGEYDTAVILRRDEIVEQLDSRFTILNRLLGSTAANTAANLKASISLTGDLKLLDSINGDKRCKLDADIQVLRSGNVINLTAQADLGDLAALAESSPEMAALRSVLKNAKLELIYDGDGGMMYLKMSGMSHLSYGMYSDNSWIAAPVASLDEMGMLELTSIGAFLYQNELSYSWYGTPVLLYQDMMDSAEELAAYLGDGCFESRGGYDVIHYGQEEYEAQLAEEYGEDYVDWASEFEQLELELKVAKSGASTFRVLVQNKDNGYSDVYVVDASGSISKSRVDMKLLLRMKNQFDLELKYTAVTSETRETARTAPAAGEKVINPYEGYEDLFAELEP